MGDPGTGQSQTLQSLFGYASAVLHYADEKAYNLDQIPDRFSAALGKSLPKNKKLWPGIAEAGWRHSRTSRSKQNVCVGKILWHRQECLCHISQINLTPSLRSV